MIRAAWLGSWKAPWGAERGRRWGDAPWALLALSQAWLLGGREGRWPRLAWESGRPLGPRPAGRPERFEALPDAPWIAQLRQGSAQLPAEQAGPREDPLRRWCWEALLKGDAEPWFAAAPALLDLETRLRWIPLLAAVEKDALRLPPFLELLLPAALKGPLPEGWAEALLADLDPEGRLLPQGDPPLELPWEAIRPHAEALLLPELPAALAPFRGAPWLCELEGGWMLDPRLRAWARGWGLAPGGLAPLRPHGLAFGDAPGPELTALLAGRLPAHPPAGWEASLKADLAEIRPRPAPPPACSEPSWDRLRMRWGGEDAAAAPGYPAWGGGPSPCADPFHWMAEGQRALAATDTERALRAFTLAHAHFARLGARSWAERAAANAGMAAFWWLDLPSLPAWHAAQSTPPAPFLDLREAHMAYIHGENQEAERLVRRILRGHRGFVDAWIFLAELGLEMDHPEWIREALPELPEHPLTELLRRALAGPLGAPPEGLDAEMQLIWEAHRTRRRECGAAGFWAAFAACPNKLIGLRGGLLVLEARPEERRPEHLMPLQVLADRTGLELYRARVGALWPSAGAGAEAPPRRRLEDWLQSQANPVWLLWGASDLLGHGEAPPEGLLGHLRQAGHCVPCEAGGWIWWGLPLHWEGAPVGAALLASRPGETLTPPAEVFLAAPWLAKLQERAPAPPPDTEGLLLTDGSEPMATLLRELQRVAPSELSVLVLGPTGSGKELAARELHRRSGRGGHLVAINCAAFAENLLESELFGHVKGAFTGASQDRRGAIETAQNGTLFLDEVADLSPRLQSLLLRVLQEREVRRVGSDRAVRVDVRFVAATHRPLEELAASGQFRRDLLFRLQGAVLRLPALAARRHELGFLLPRLVAQLCREMKRSAPALAPGLDKALARLPWPGNFRELRHALERALLRCGEGPLGPTHFPELDAPQAPSRGWEEATRDFQRRFLLETLRHHGFHAAEAARALGLARPALYNAAKRLGLDLVQARGVWEAEHPEG